MEEYGHIFLAVNQLLERFVLEKVTERDETQATVVKTAESYSGHLVHFYESIRQGVADNRAKMLLAETHPHLATDASLLFTLIFAAF